MSYLKFNEGVFSDLRDRVNSNIDAIKNASSTIAGNTLGVIKNLAVRTKDLANSASEGIHNIGNKIGAAGFENDKDPRGLHQTVGNNNLNGPDISLKSKLYDNRVVDMMNHDKATNKANAIHNLQQMGLAGSKHNLDIDRLSKLKQEEEIKKLKSKYGV